MPVERLFRFLEAEPAVPEEADDPANQGPRGADGPAAADVWITGYVTGALARLRLRKRDHPAAEKALTDRLQAHALAYARTRGRKTLELDLVKAYVQTPEWERAMERLIEDPSSGALPPAGLARRAGALLVDAPIVVALTMFVSFWVVGGLTQSGLLTATAVILVPIVGMAGAEHYWGGSPGKRFFDIEVVRPDGSRPPWGAALARTVTKLVPPFLALDLMYYATAGRSSRQRLTDRWARVRVVRRSGRALLSRSALEEMAGPVSPPSFQSFAGLR